MNVLLTSAGRRNYLVSYFRNALSGSGKVLAADVDPNAAALQVADEAVVVPPFSDPEYFDYLRHICVKYAVKLVISLNDMEIPLLARQKETFRSIGVCVLVSEPSLVDSCLDKWQTYSLMSRAGISVPLTYCSLSEAQQALASGELQFPVVIKPRWGTGSIGVEIAYSVSELVAAFEVVKSKAIRTIVGMLSRQDPDRCVLVQEMLVGAEYGLDVINDLDGNYVTTFVRRKLGMRAGETDKAVIIEDPKLSSLGRRLGELTRHVAIMDCDVFVEETGNVKVLEMNPRFGGGYPFSHMAGANIPAAILAWLRGEKPKTEFLRVKAGVTSSKYDELVAVKSRTTLQG